MDHDATPEKWAYSRDQEQYHGDFATWWDAVLGGLPRDADDSAGVWVGKCEPPWPPEDHGFADVVIEHIQEQDDYRGEWADDWPGASKEQYAELEALLSAALAGWLDKHGLRPKFFTVPESQCRTKGEALAAQAAHAAGAVT